MDLGNLKRPVVQTGLLREFLLASFLAAWYKRQTVESSVASRAFESLVACLASKGSKPAEKQELAGIGLGHEVAHSGTEFLEGLMRGGSGIHA